MKQLLEMAGKLQKQLGEAQAQQTNARFNGEAGGGLVKVILDGRHRVLEVKIDPSVVDPKDVSLLEDLVRAALNQASSALGEGLHRQLGGMAQGLGIDLNQFKPPGSEGSDGSGSGGSAP